MVASSREEPPPPFYSLSLWLAPDLKKGPLTLLYRSKYSGEDELYTR